MKSPKQYIAFFLLLFKKMKNKYLLIFISLFYLNSVFANDKHFQIILLEEYFATYLLQYNENIDSITTQFFPKDNSCMNSFCGQNYFEKLVKKEDDITIMNNCFFTRVLRIKDTLTIEKYDMMNPKYQRLFEKKAIFKSQKVDEYICLDKIKKDTLVVKIDRKFKERIFYRFYKGNDLLYEYDFHLTNDNKIFSIVKHSMETCKSKILYMGKKNNFEILIMHNKLEIINKCIKYADFNSPCNEFELSKINNRESSCGELKVNLY
jgi:hypothetical protein